MLKYTRQSDPEIYELVVEELHRQEKNIEMIASESTVPLEVMELSGSVFTNKTLEGLPGKRFQAGSEVADKLEELGWKRAKELFGAEHVNLQSYSGSTANYSVFASVLEPGDKILAMRLDQGGHLTHGSPVNFSGKDYKMVSYGLDVATGRIDYDQVRDLAKQHQPKMIIAGASAYPRAIDFKVFADIAHEVGAYLMVDMAHIAGLVAGGQHMSPVPYADIVTTTTHKTLRGTRGGLILTNDEAIAKRVNSAIFPGAQGGPLMHIIAAKAVALGEALKPEFKVYAEQVVKNAKAMADAILAGGLDLVSGGTDNHLMLVDLRPAGLTGKVMENRLDDVYITANKNAIPDDPEKPFVTSGLRLGTPAATTRGFDENDCALVGKLICQTAMEYDTKADQIRDAVVALTDKHPLYK